MAAPAINKRIALTVALAAILIGLVFVVAIGAMPGRLFALINNVPIKTLLIICVELSIFWIAVLFYLYYHYPRPRRLLVILFYWLLGLLMFSAPTPIVLAALLSVPDYNISIDLMYGGSASSAIMFICGIVAIIVTVRDYTALAKYEQRNGVVE